MHYSYSIARVRCMHADVRVENAKSGLTPVSASALTTRAISPRKSSWSTRWGNSSTAVSRRRRAGIPSRRRGVPFLSAHPAARFLNLGWVQARPNSSAISAPAAKPSHRIPPKRRSSIRLESFPKKPASRISPSTFSSGRVHVNCSAKQNELRRKGKGHATSLRQFASIAMTLSSSLVRPHGQDTPSTKSSPTSPAPAAFPAARPAPCPLTI